MNARTVAKRNRDGAGPRSSTRRGDASQRSQSRFVAEIPDLMWWKLSSRYGSSPAFVTSTMNAHDKLARARGGFTSPVGERKDRPLRHNGGGRSRGEPVAAPRTARLRK
tara:strand:- start:5500 stop:5826 length:327 start_codon:yes stop_codon:yes gene_type:complete